MATRWIPVVALLGMIATGCATSATVKDASTKHSSNLAALQQTVGSYRKQLGVYYGRLIQQQREAYIAQYVRTVVNRTAKEQSESIADSIQENREPQKPADDFIKAGEQLSAAFDEGADLFDRWTKKDTTLEQVRKAFRDLAEAELKEVEKLKAAGKLDEAEKRRRRAVKMQDEAQKDEDELAAVVAAIQLRDQLTSLDTQLNLLAAQVTTMQAFHAKINEFLAIDATIDGQKIAAAAAAGSKADVSGIVPKK